MSENKIELLAISELFGKNFFIPNYQRGYRWTKQHVKDLLDDLDEFIHNKTDGFYCLQPLVVKRKISNSDDFKQKVQNIDVANSDLLNQTSKLIQEYTRWEVIDGQQRLTTIYIILSCLDCGESYSIKYDTRYRSEEFLENINESESENNIDFHFMYEAKCIIDNWFKDYDSKDQFKDFLLNKVKFIWYQTNEESIPVFTRLNIGKIPLTNSELIKALFLNRSNFQGKDYYKRQKEIAAEWDSIEYTLQKDEFWLFLHEKKYDYSTRIEFLFDFICEENLFKIPDTDIEKIGADSYRTFRYFYSHFKVSKKDNQIDSWKEIKKIFQTFEEWFNNFELYHYIGYLICIKSDSSKKGIVKYIYSECIKNTKFKFIEFLKEEISKEINIDNSPPKDWKEEILNLTYDNKISKIKKILLLHNVQTIVNQNISLKKDNKYRLPVFYKFPFHLYKLEQWDVEHIDSSTTNELNKISEQKEWLRYSSLLGLDKKLQEEIRKFIKTNDEKTNDDENIGFQELYDQIIKLNPSKNQFENNEGNLIWNLTLLDSKTNRSYKNAIFSAKRRVLIGKDMGKKITIDDELKVKEEVGAIAFIPPCTKNVFLKYYNTTTDNLRDWNKNDAEAYLKNIEQTLTEYIN